MKAFVTLSEKMADAPRMTGRRIVFVINSLHTGGAERVLDTLLRHAEGRISENEVHLVLLDDQPIMRDLPPLTGRHVLDGRMSLARSLMQVRRILDELKPDLVISLLIRANVASALWRRKGTAPVILCERMHAGSHLAGRYRPAARFMIRQIMRFAYRRADAILAVSQGVADDLIERFGLDGEKIKVINNPYDGEAIFRSGAAEPTIALPHSFIVASGRLVAAKNFSMLLNAYAAADIDDDLVILGEGEERAALEAEISQLGLAGRVHLPGFIENPFAVVARARFLVSASRNEGFPNAIAEAMVLGRPVIATDCPSGPGELLGGRSTQPGSVVTAPNGLLVPDGDAVALTRAITMMNHYPAMRSAYALKARQRMIDFRAEVIAAHYWRFFDQWVARRTL